MKRKAQALADSSGIHQLKDFIRPFKAVRTDPIVQFETGFDQRTWVDFMPTGALMIPALLD